MSSQSGEVQKSSWSNAAVNEDTVSTFDQILLSGLLYFNIVVVARRLVKLQKLIQNMVSLKIYVVD